MNNLKDSLTELSCEESSEIIGGGLSITGLCATLARTCEHAGPIYNDMCFWYDRTCR